MTMKQSNQDTKNNLTMLEVHVPDSCIKQATAMSKKMGMLNNSITQGKGKVAGFIGEIIVAKFLNAEHKNTYDYDLIYNNKKIDVKTKRVSTRPKLGYECSIAETSTHQNCDIYVFTRVKKDYSIIWLLGYLEKDLYFRKANFLKKGTIDPSNNWKVLTSCYNIPISELKQINLLDEYY